MALSRSHAKKMRPVLHVQLNPVQANTASPSPAPQLLNSKPLLDFLVRNPRDSARETQYTVASGADRNPRSIRSIPETPGGSRGSDPLMNYTLRPEDIVTVKKLGEGAGGTVSKVKHVPTGFVMARK
ncbi:hypothetical protein BGZ76_006468, partial [Entomortierella beljakovae]